jgi:hypothetical protein
MNFQIGQEPGHEDEIDRAVADHLIGDPYIAAPGISGLGWFHEIRVELTIPTHYHGVMSPLSSVTSPPANKPIRPKPSPRRNRRMLSAPRGRV